jgi:putative membrane protein
MTAPDPSPSREVAESAAHLEASAGAIRASADQQTDSADRRTELAADRTILAAERTYAAWVRTGLASLASGVGARTLLASLLPDWLGALTGSVLIAFSIFCFVAAVWREMEPGAPPPRPDTRRLPAVLLIGVTGFLVVVCLAALVAIWVAPRAR